MPSIVHWDDVEEKHHVLGELSARWRFLGEAAGTVGVGLRLIAIDPGKRSTPAHVHGAEEEIFFVLRGTGLLWQNGETCALGEGDCIVHLPETQAHTLRAGPEGFDVLVFGTRVPVEICHLPRTGMAWAGPTVVAAPGLHNLWENEAKAGPLEFPPPGPRPPNVVALETVSAEVFPRGRARAAARRLATAAGSKRTGLNHVELKPGSEGAPPHCHSAEEELFVILRGSGVCRIGSDEQAVRRGHVVSRPAGTRIAHAFRAGPDGLTYLAYGTREPNDITYYPRSNKVFFRGLGLIGRIEPLDYWDGEE